MSDCDDWDYSGDEAEHWDPEDPSSRTRPDECSCMCVLNVLWWFFCLLMCHL